VRCFGTRLKTQFMKVWPGLSDLMAYGGRGLARGLNLSSEIDHEIKTSLVNYE